MRRIHNTEVFLTLLSFLLVGGGVWVVDRTRVPFDGLPVERVCHYDVDDDGLLRGLVQHVPHVVLVSYGWVHLYRCRGVNLAEE